LWAVAVAAAAAGAVGWDVIGATLTRTAPVLAFAAFVTALAELSRDAGVFTSAAERLARLAGGRRSLLFAAVVALAVLATAFLSLDTTAVLLTPVVIALAAHTGSGPVPFAMATVWLANTASLTLPVSNLTNLLAVDRHPVSPGQWLGSYGLVSAAAILATCAVLWLLFRREVRGRFVLAELTPVQDRIVWLTTVAVLVVALPLLVTEIPPWITAAVAAAVLGAVGLIRRSATPRHMVRHIPWRVLIFASGLFAVAGIAEDVWLADAATNLAPPTGPALAASGALLANLVNNLPAYLALEPFAASAYLSGALLIGVNVGPLITPWASLATLLWHRQLVRHGVEVPWVRYMAWGALCAPVAMAAAITVHMLVNG
jgi:arsenical pump membrane protein